MQQVLEFLNGHQRQKPIHEGEDSLEAENQEDDIQISSICALAFGTNRAERLTQKKIACIELARFRTYLGADRVW